DEAAITDLRQPEGLAGTPGIYRPHDSARPRIRSLSLPPASTLRIRDRARDEATTVHGALCAALVEAGRRVHGSWRNIPVRVLSPINTRGISGVGRDCGVFVSAATTAYEPEITDFWELARRARADVCFGQTRTGIAALRSRLRHVVRNGLDVAAA